MQEKIKVNVTFQLEVPVQKDSAGRRRSIPDQVSPYISDYLSDLQIEMQSLRFKHIRDDVKDNYDAQKDYDIFAKIEDKGAVYLDEQNKQAEESRIRWEKQKNFECYELYRMSWNEFKTLSWTDQAKMREKHGVVWEDGAWVKKGPVLPPEFKINVNGKWMTTNKTELSYEDILQLAESKNPDIIHSMTFWVKGSNHQGILSPGKKVMATNNLILNAVITGNA